MISWMELRMKMMVVMGEEEKRNEVKGSEGKGGEERK